MRDQHRRSNPTAHSHGETPTFSQSLRPHTEGSQDSCGSRWQGRNPDRPFGRSHPVSESGSGKLGDEEFLEVAHGPRCGPCCWIMVRGATHEFVGYAGLCASRVWLMVRGYVFSVSKFGIYCNMCQIKLSRF